MKFMKVICKIVVLEFIIFSFVMSQSIKIAMIDKKKYNINDKHKEILSFFSNVSFETLNDWNKYLIFDYFFYENFEAQENNDDEYKKLNDRNKNFQNFTDFFEIFLNNSERNIPNNYFTKCKNKNYILENGCDLETLKKINNLLAIVKVNYGEYCSDLIDEILCDHYCGKTTNRNDILSDDKVYQYKEYFFISMNTCTNFLTKCHKIKIFDEYSFNNTSNRFFEYRYRLSNNNIETQKNFSSLFMSSKTIYLTNNTKIFQENKNFNLNEDNNHIFDKNPNLNGGIYDSIVNDEKENVNIWNSIYKEICENEISNVAQLNENVKIKIVKHQELKTNRGLDIFDHDCKIESNSYSDYEPFYEEIENEKEDTRKYLELDYNIESIEKIYRHLDLKIKNSTLNNLIKKNLKENILKYEKTKVNKDKLNYLFFLIERNLNQYNMKHKPFLQLKIKNKNNLIENIFLNISDIDFSFNTYDKNIIYILKDFIKNMNNNFLDIFGKEPLFGIEKILDESYINSKEEFIKMLRQEFRILIKRLESNFYTYKEINTYYLKDLDDDFLKLSDLFMKNTEAYYNFILDYIIFIEPFTILRKADFEQTVKMRLIFFEYLQTIFSQMFRDLYLKNYNRYIFEQKDFDPLILAVFALLNSEKYSTRSYNYFKNSWNKPLIKLDHHLKNKYYFIDKNYIELILNENFKYYFDSLHLYLEKFDLFEPEIKNERSYISCLNKKIGFDIKYKTQIMPKYLEKQNEKIINSIKKIRNFDLIKENNKNIIRANKTSQNPIPMFSNMSTLNLIKWKNDMSHNDIMNKNFTYYPILNNETISHSIFINNEKKNLLPFEQIYKTKEFPIYTQSEKINKTIFYESKAHNQSNKYNITIEQAIKNQSRAPETFVLVKKEDYHKCKNHKDIKNTTSYFEEQFKNFITNKNMKNKSVIILDNNKIEKIFYKNGSYFFKNQSCQSVNKIKYKSPPLDIKNKKLNIKFVDKNIIKKQNKTRVEVINKSFILDPKDKNFFNKNEVNITINLKDIEVLNSPKNTSYNIDLDDLLKKKVLEIEKLNLKNNKDLQFYQMLFNILKAKLAPNSFNNKQNSSHIIHKNISIEKPIAIYKSPKVSGFKNFTNLTIKIHSNNNLNYSFNTLLDNTLNASEISLKINETETLEKVKVKIVEVNKTIYKNCSREIVIKENTVKEIKSEKEDVYDMRNSTDVNIVLNESLRNVYLFIDLYKYIQTLSDLFFEPFDNIDAYRELNKTIDNLLLSNSSVTSLKRINRKMKENIIFIEKGKSLDKIHTENLKKLANFESIFDNLIVIPRKRDLVNNDNIKRKNYILLNQALGKNIDFLNIFFENYKSKLNDLLNDSDLSNNPYGINLKDLFEQIKYYQSNFLSFVSLNFRDDLNVVSDTHESDNEIDSDRKKIDDIFKKRMQNFLEYKNQIGKYVILIKSTHIVYKLFNLGFDKIKLLFTKSNSFNIKIKNLNNILVNEKSLIRKLFFISKMSLNSFIQKLPKRSHKIKNFQIASPIKNLRYEDLMNLVIQKENTDPLINDNYISKYLTFYNDLISGHQTQLNITSNDIDHISELLPINKLFEMNWNNFYRIINLLFDKEIKIKSTFVKSLYNSKIFNQIKTSLGSKEEIVNNVFEFLDSKQHKLTYDFIEPLKNFTEEIREVILKLDIIDDLNLNKTLDNELKYLKFKIVSFQNILFKHISEEDMLSSDEKIIFDYRKNKKLDIFNKYFVNHYSERLLNYVEELKDINNEYSFISNNLVNLQIYIINLIEKIKNKEERKKFNSEKSQLNDQLKNLTQLIYELKNNQTKLLKSNQELDHKTSNHTYNPIILNESINKKILKPDNIQKNKTINITKSMNYETISNVNTQDYERGIFYWILYILLLLILISFYLSIFKKIIIYSANFLFNSNLKLNLFNKGIIFWTIIIISISTAIIGEILYKEILFFLGFAILGEFISASLIFKEDAGMLFGMFSFMILGITTGLKIFLFTNSLIFYVTLNLIWACLLMALGSFLGYINIFLYEKEELGDYLLNKIRLGDKINYSSNKSNDKIIEDGNE